MSRTLYASVTDTNNILTVSLQQSHGSQTAAITVEAESTDLTIGDTIDVDIGYTDEHQTIFTGFVKQMEISEPDQKVTITAVDTLIRAMDYFIVSSTPDSQYTRSSIKAEDLVGELMAMAGLTDYSYDPTMFTFGIQTPVQVNITSAYDYCRFIADILAWHIYADPSTGTVYFVDRKPYVMGGDSSYKTITKAISMTFAHGRDDADLRNRIVVYGSTGIAAEASAPSEFLPDGFYKSVLVSAPGVIDTQEMAQMAADYNLALLNRLTESCSIVVLGDPALQARKVITLNVGDASIDGDWYLFSCTHYISKAGYTCELEIRK